MRVSMSKPAHAPSISKEEIATLPVRRYEGEVRLVETPEDIALAMDDVSGERIVGFDTETRPAFRKGEVYLPALVMVLRRRNEGPAPEWLDRLAVRLPHWLRGQAAQSTA